MDLKELELVDPSKHWYYQAKLTAIRLALDSFAPNARSFIDVGAGSGFFSMEVADFDAGTHVVCVDPNYPSEREERSGRVRFVHNPPSDGADVYLLIDVLEHVPDERRLIAPYLTTAPPGAIFIVTVPAFMSMWSPHDDYLEHFRRYTLSGLCQTLRESGLEIVHQQYLFGSIFPLAWIMRRLRRDKHSGSDLRTTSRLINSVLKSVLVAEHRLKRNRLAGISAMAVARLPRG